MKFVLVALAFLAAIGALILVATQGDHDEDVADPAVCTYSGRYAEDELHAAWQMTQRMGRPDAPPMWNDEQLRLAQGDPTFVSDLECHTLRMGRMLGAG